MKNLLDKIKSLFEKVKTLDKKVLIGASAGIVALIVAIIVILVVCLGGKDTDANKDDTYKNDKVDETSDKDDDKDKDKEDESDDKKEASFIVKVVDKEGNPVAGVVVKIANNGEEGVQATSDEDGFATFDVEITEGYKLSVVTCPEGYEYTGEAEVALESGATEYELKIQKKAEGGANTQLDTTQKEDGSEILGQGTKEQPLVEWPQVNSNNVTLTTISVPSGKTLYYEIYNVGNMILTINDANVYVIESNGTRHDAKNGVVSFTVEYAMSGEIVAFQIGNKGTASKTFTLVFTNKTGSYMAPAMLNNTSLNTGVSLTLAGGDKNSDAAVGYYYKYTADKTGYVRFYFESSVAGQMNIQNDNVNQTIAKNTSSDLVKDMDGKDCIEFKVNQGDQLIIHLGVDKQGRTYPTATIRLSGVYSETSIIPE